MKAGLNGRLLAPDVSVVVEACSCFDSYSASGTGSGVLVDQHRGHAWKCTRPQSAWEVLFEKERGSADPDDQRSLMSSQPVGRV